MPFNTTRARKHLQAGELKTLFIEELGWDRLKTTLPVTVSDETFTLSPIAEKRGVQIFQCSPRANGKIPEYAIRRKIEADVTKSAFQHVIVFTDKKAATQIWQWVSRETGKPLAYREQAYYVGQSGDALLQKLERIAFALSEEDGLTLSGVEFKLKDAFDKEKVTKKFYERFQKEHDTFLGFIKNIPDGDLQRWYASVMINRLMFLYFIQAKDFLDSDPTYLKTKLKQSQGHFYRDFLCPLFFEGFASRIHSAEITKKLGKVPYLNGGLFARHQIEELYGEAIAIPDTAFEKLFAFFDGYNWHLDDRPLRNDNEINPDVLGYIFEKYINQKQMGAYYTKEDITEYIGKNTILPFLLDHAREDCQVAFQGEGGLWRLLREDPDRYLYPAVRHGMELALPDVIAQGVQNVAARGGWNKPAPSDFGLPTEIWREVVARRQRCAEVRAQLAAGEVRDVADLITHNLNIRQFAQDCIEEGGTDFVQAVWNVLNGTREGRLPMSVLDPTCGSGAFLFAALEILEPLYEACLDRMASFVADADQLGHAKAHPQFRDLLQSVAAHADRRYFVLKSIIVNNLFGVDIMEEATEICKLRLFLTLAAQVEADPKKDNLGIEPLPDIDFNIRAGNTLVGFATEAQTEKAVTSRLDFENVWPTIQSKAAAIAKLFETFQQSQNDLNAEPAYVTGMKKGLRERLQALRDELDKYLGQQYGKVGKESFVDWKKTAHPFHWFIEFYNVMKAGGFDVQIGNPPYVEYSKVKQNYQVKGYKSERCGNIYAFVMERCLDLLDAQGYCGLIVPTAVACTDRMLDLREIFKKRNDGIFVSHFAIRPSKLFEGVDQRVSVVLSGKMFGCGVAATKYNKWTSEERPSVFSLVSYSPSPSVHKNVWCKNGSKVATDILAKIEAIKQYLGSYTAKTSKNIVYYKNTGVNHWLCVTSEAPKCFRGKDASSSSRETHLYFESQQYANAVLCILNSSIFFFRYQQVTNCRDFNPSDISTFPIPSGLMKEDFSTLAKKLSQDMEEKSGWVVREQNQTGTIRLQFFRPRLSKPIIDQIDRVLAKHYGFTDEETDFIINYDIKYRMGRGGNEAEED